MSEVVEPTTELGIVDGVLQAFATGTFIFVTFFEILQEEIDSHDTSIGKVSSALAGFIVMCLIMLIPHPPENGTSTIVDAFLANRLSNRRLAIWHEDDVCRL